MKNCSSDDPKKEFLNLINICNFLNKILNKALILKKDNEFKKNLIEIKNVIEKIYKKLKNKQKCRFDTFISWSGLLQAMHCGWDDRLI